MVRVQSEIKCGLLRCIKRGIPADGSILEGLNAFQEAIATNTFRTGRLLVSTSGSGQSASFVIPGQVTQLSQETACALSEELFRVHDDAVTNGADAADKEAMFTAMADDDRLRGVRQLHGDFSNLNVGAA